MKATTAVGVSILALIAWNIFNKAAAAGGLYFYPASVKNIHFQGATPIMTIGLAVQNVSNQQLVMHSLAGNLYADNYLIGNLSSFTPQTIAPNSETVLYIDVKLQLIGIVNTIIRDFQMGNFSQKLNFNASANVDKYVVPIKIEYKIGA